jgi:ABC-2 type transport system permease protein
VAVTSVSDRVRGQVRSYLTEGLLKATPSERRKRIAQGATLLHLSLTDQRESSLQLAFQWGLAAFVLGAFYFINSSSTSDMFSALHEEKRKKTIEISLTSVTVPQLLIGKVAGVVSTGLAQFAVWFVGAGAMAGLAWFVLRPSGVTLATEPLFNTLALCLGLLLPAYIMNAISVVVISSLADLAGRGEQVVSLITNLLGTLVGPLTLIAISSPDNPLAVVLSILPFTSPMLMVMRYVQVIVPAWQIVLAIGLVWGLMLFNILIAARVYRATWLLAGHKNWLRSVGWALVGK